MYQIVDEVREYLKNQRTKIPDKF